MVRNTILSTQERTTAISLFMTDTIRQIKTPGGRTTAVRTQLLPFLSEKSSKYDNELRVELLDIDKDVCFLIYKSWIGDKPNVKLVNRLFDRQNEVMSWVYPVIFAIIVFVIVHIWG